MTVAVHQPNYLPWLGYFYKIFASDVFVFHDTVGFSTSSYTKRCKIRVERTSAETTWLSVPVQSHDTGISIYEIRIAHRTDWVSRHLNKIENTYRNAPYFDEVFPWLSEILADARKLSGLAELNEKLIKQILERLSIRTQLRRASEMRIDEKGAQLIRRIVINVGGDHYLTGIGSRKYMDERVLQDAGIRTIVHDFGNWLKTHPYDQGMPEFTGGLSVVDALMHVGVDGIKQLFREFHKDLLNENPVLYGRV